MFPLSFTIEENCLLIYTCMDVLNAKSEERKNWKLYLWELQI